LFSSVRVPLRSAVPARGLTHMLSKLAEGWNTPACQVLEPPPLLLLPKPPPLPPLPPLPPPPQEANATKIGSSKTLNLA